MPWNGKALRHDWEVVHHNGKKESSSGVCEEPMEWNRDWTENRINAMGEEVRKTWSVIPWSENGNIYDVKEKCINEELNMKKETH